MEPNYNLLIAVISAVIFLGWALQELLITYMFTDEDIKLMNENKDDNKKF